MPTSRFAYVKKLKEEREMLRRLSISLGVNLQPPLLAVNMKRLAVLNVVELVGLIVELVGVVDVLRIDLVAE